MSTLSAFLTELDIYGIDGAIAISFFVTASITLGYWIKVSREMVQKQAFDPRQDTSNVKFSHLMTSSIAFFKRCCEKKDDDSIQLTEETLPLENQAGL